MPPFGGRGGLASVPGAGHPGRGAASPRRPTGRTPPADRTFEEPVERGRRVFVDEGGLQAGTPLIQHLRWVSGRVRRVNLLGLSARPGAKANAGLHDSLGGRARSVPSRLRNRGRDNVVRAKEPRASRIRMRPAFPTVGASAYSARTRPAPHAAMSLGSAGTASVGRAR